MKMKELERETGVGRETIRFYIREGLLPEPERPKRNVAHYGQVHVERLKFIKRLQSDRFLPLSVIRAILQSGQAEPRGGIDELLGLENRLYPLLASAKSFEAQPVEEVAAEAGLSIEQVLDFELMGLVRCQERDGTKWVDERNSRIVSLMGEIERLGFNEELGFPSDYWTLYVDFVGWLAQREVSHFYEKIGSSLPQDKSAALAAEGIRLINDLLPLLRVEFVIQEMRRISALGRLPAPAEEDRAGLV